MVSLEQHDVKGREAMLGHMNIIGFHIMKVGLSFPSAMTGLCVYGYRGGGVGRRGRGCVYVFIHLRVSE